MANRLAKVVMTLDGQRVEVGLDRIREKTRQLKDEMHKLAMDGKQNTKEYKDRQKAVEKLHKAEEDVADVTKRINQYMKNLGDVATTDLRRAYREGIQLRDGFKGADAELQKLNKNLAKIKQQIDVNTDTVKKHQGVWGTLGTTIKNLFAYAGIFAGFNKMKSLMEGVFRQSLSLSDSMAQVQKVTGLAKQEVDSLNTSFGKIDTRTTLSQLNDLAYSAGKMGLGQYGLEGIEGFVKATNQLQVALGDDLGATVDESITPLAKLAENMGLLKSMGVEKSMMAIGSSINELSQTTTATGKNIVDFARRIQAAGQMAGLSVADILALGSAADSMGISSEIAGTSFVKFLSSLRTNTDNIERSLGIAKGTIDEFYKQGNMMEAVMLIFDRMHRIGDLRTLTPVFKELGSEGSRMSTVFASMSKNINMLETQLSTSRQSFEEAISVTREYNIVNSTAEGLMERASNIWQKAFVDPQGVDTVKKFAQAWYDVSRSMTGNKAVMAEIKFIMAGILELIKGITYLLPSLMYGLTALGGYRLGAMIVTGLKPAWDAVRGMTLSVAALRTGFMALSTVARANIFGAAVTTIFALISMFGSLNKKVKEASGYMEGFDGSLRELNLHYGEGEMRLRRYRQAIDEANVGSKQRIGAIRAFNKEFRPYMSHLLNEKATALDVANAYNEITKAMRAKMALQLKEKDYEKHVTPRERWTVQRRDRKSTRLNSSHVHGSRMPSSA